MHGYNIPPIMFTESEAAALFLSGEIAERYGDESLIKSLQNALLKVRSALPEGHKNYIHKLGTSVDVWGYSKTYKDKTILMPIQEAVVKRRCIDIHYKTGGRDKTTERTVEPLGLLFYSRQWHLIGWCRLRRSIRDFRLDRIKEWKVTSETFSGHNDFSLSEFIEQEIDSNELIPVEIECEPRVIDRITDCLLYTSPSPRDA